MHEIAAKKGHNYWALKTSASSWFSQDYFKGILLLELLITNDLRVIEFRFRSLSCLPT